MIFQTFKNRPVKTTLSIVLLLVGVYTFVQYQEINVTSVNQFFNILIDTRYDKSSLYLTCGLNLLSVVGFISLGVAWFKDVFGYNHDDDYPEYSKIICFIMSILCFCASLIFISFIFTRLIGMVIVVAIVALFLYGNTPSQRRK